MAEAHCQLRLELLGNWGMSMRMNLYLGPMMQEGQLGQTRPAQFLQIIATVIFTFSTAAACLAGVALCFAYLLMVYTYAMVVGEMTSAETFLRQNAKVCAYIFRGVLVLSSIVACFAHFLVTLLLHECGVVNAWQFRQDEEPEAGDIANAEVNGDVANAEAGDIANAEAEDIANPEAEDIANVVASDETEDVLTEVGDATDHVDAGDVAAGGSGTEEASENFRDALVPVEPSVDPFSRIDLPVPRISQSPLLRVPALVGNLLKRTGGRIVR